MKALLREVNQTVRVLSEKQVQIRKRIPIVKAYQPLTECDPHLVQRITRLIAQKLILSSMKTKVLLKA